ncbi:peptidyl-prolyl cis-trans isomerase G [Bradysia coprophila]|uniref:peptidyl-prolyl cis-trans isomerase G n=1 Tax=Bradysia coprophila TaxID=38358 RepID=UPI00187DBC6C|nr:peptidyl-prolyl cis-trans isomerase G [Bradysia coprophila]
MTVGEEDEPPARIRCFFDINLGGLPAGRVVFELYPDITPKTVENFRALCTGEMGIGKITEKPLHYKGVVFHRVVKNFMIQSGDFSANNGTGGESIYGGTFDDENFQLKHDKPFLLSMANRGKGTNGSQFFITTQPASHLDNIHVVFGHVVSGHDLVRQIEQLPVDRNSRPLQDAVISNCGELVRQVKTKKDKKEKKKRKQEDSSSSDDEDERKKKKDKKKKKKSKDEENDKTTVDPNEEHEEGEIDDEDVHPMVKITKIDPKDIPEVSNKFLMRGNGSGTEATKDEKEGNVKDKEKDKDKDRRKDKDKDRRDSGRNFGWSKRRVPLSRSGRAIKGRGVFRYRTPSRSRSRSRSVTPPHWKQAQKRTIKLSDLEKSEEDKRLREEEIKRREAERKKRHEEVARVAKKSFFEINQENSYSNVKRDAKSFAEKEDGEIDTSANISSKDVKTDDETRFSEAVEAVDMNALDYEDGEENEDAVGNKNKSESMALAFGVQVKPNEIPPRNEKENDSKRKRESNLNGDERSKGKRDDKRDRDTQRSRHDSMRKGSRRSRSNNRSRNSPARSRFDRNNRGVDRSRGAGRNQDRRRSRTSRSYDRYDRTRKQSNERRRSRDRRHQRSRSLSERDRSRPREVSSRQDTKPRSRDRNRSHSKHRSRSPYKSRRDDKSKSRSPSRSRSKNKREKSSEENTSYNERERINKEKMMKRAEAILLLKDHMRKEILEQERRQAEKQKQKEDMERAEAEKEIARLEKIKQETLDKLKAQEIKQLAAVKKVLEVVVSSVSRKSRRSSSEDSDDDREKRKKRSDRRKKIR